jgi:hypothetical protein
MHLPHQQTSFRIFKILKQVQDDREKDPVYLSSAGRQVQDDTPSVIPDSDPESQDVSEILKQVQSLHSA